MTDISFYVDYFNIMNLLFQSADDHYIYQLWYDDPESLKIKFNLIESLGLLGAGNWESDSLNYSDPIQVREMWGAFP